MDDDTTPIEEVEEDVEIEGHSEGNDSNIIEAPILTESKQPVNLVPVSKPVKKSSIFKYFFFILLILMLMAAAAGATYLWRVKVASDLEKAQNVQIVALNSEITSLKNRLANVITVTDPKSPVALCDDAVVCTPVMPNAATIENIKASITSGNTAALEGYMATDVTVILAASEAYGSQTKTQAVSDITSFISGAKSPWDFLLAASILSSYGKGGYGKYFTTIDTVGKSADGKVISFLFDCDGKISTVFMSSSEELLN